MKDAYACPKCGNESGHTILSRGVLFHCTNPKCEYRWEERLSELTEAQYEVLRQDGVKLTNAAIDRAVKTVQGMCKIK